MNYSIMWKSLATTVMLFSIMDYKCIVHVHSYYVWGIIEGVTCTYCNVNNNYSNYTTGYN